MVSILGSSGSGKSTLLRCMNWLEQPDRGEIHIGGQRLGIDEQRGRAMSHRQLAKIRERVGMVFQSFNLWPHLTVQQNVSEALLRVKGMKRDEAKAMAMQQLEKVGMAHKADVYPITLSADRSSGWRSPVRWRCRRKLFSSMNRRRRWIRNWLMRCWGNESPCRRGLHHGGGDPRDGFCPPCPTRWCFWRRDC